MIPCLTSDPVLAGMLAAFCLVYAAVWIGAVVSAARRLDAEHRELAREARRHAADSSSESYSDLDERGSWGGETRER